MAEPRDDAPTLAALGVLAATLAAVAHEALGHGGACLAAGGRVALLTALFFRCHGAVSTDLTDLAGPLGSLVCGVVAFVLLRLRPSWPISARLFLLILGAFALFWFFGQMVRDSAMAVDDWAFAAHGPGRWALVVAGALGYVATIRLCARTLRTLGGGWRRHLTPYVAGVLSAVVAGLLWRGHSERAALEGLLTLGAAPLGYVWAVRAWIRESATGAAAAIPRGWPWILTAAVVFAAFALTQGLGLGPLS